MRRLGTNNPVFYRRWVAANGWAEAVGLGTTFVVGRLLAPWLEGATGPVVALLSALVAVLLGTVLEGIVVGVAQEAVLRQHLVSLRKGAWVLATAVGAGLAWVLGMIPSTILALRPQEAVASPAAEPPALIQYTLACALGVVAGPVLGSAQWIVLRVYTPRAVRWLWANAAAWGVGMPMVFLGMDHVPWTGSRPAMVLAVYAVCGGVGLIVGAIHGRVLVRLVKTAGTEPEAVGQADAADEAPSGKGGEMSHEGLQRTRFPSKRDAWLTVLLWAAAATLVAGGATQLASQASLVVRVLVVAMLLGAATLTLWILYGTHYTFAEDELEIRSGPFRFRVPLAAVISAEPSHNPLSSPACSLDRLSIRYGRRRILVSPEDRLEFLETLARRGSNLVRQGERVVKRNDAQQGVAADKAGAGVSA